MSAIPKRRLELASIADLPGPGYGRGRVHLVAALCVMALGIREGETHDAASAQTCMLKGSDDPAAERFVQTAGGNVVDRRLGLVWQRCALGQVWEHDTCTGAPAALSWKESKQAAADLNISAEQFFNDWRVPRIHELASIVSLHCTNPRIDLAFFPGTQAAAFWSATPVPQGGGEAAFTLSFGAEGVGHDSTDARHYVRLVRSGL